MGYSLAWLAVRGKTPDQILAELGLRRTGEREGFAESDFSAALLPSGWYVVVADHRLDLLDDKILMPLSASCEIATCAVEEHVMFSLASLWKCGRKFWSVEHESYKGLEHLHQAGDLPPEFLTIRERLRAEQKAHSSGCDYIFDIPVETAHAITGYRHDADIEGLIENVDAPFEILEAIAPPARE